MEQTFTINLVSNASVQVFAGNKMAQLTLELSFRCHLAGDWEVALLDASWVPKVENITNASFMLGRFDKTSKTPTRPQYNDTVSDDYYRKKYCIQF